MPRDDAYILDILQAARVAVQLVAGMTYEVFRQDVRTVSAVLWQVAVMGEACAKISQGTRANYPSVPWREIADMRNRLIHEYMRINLPKVWETTQHDIPELIRLLEPLVPPEE